MNTVSDEDARIRKEKEKEFWANMPRLKPEDLKISPWVEEMVKNIPPMPADVDIEKLKLDYLLEKYG